MKRAPIVLSSTALGLAGVLSVHLAKPTSTLTPTRAPTKTTASSTAQSASTSTTSTASAAKTSSASSTASTVRSATGDDVSFRYGDLKVKVTVSGTKITNAAIVALNPSDPHSQQIDDFAIPQLTQEAMAAGSGQIDAISGASYTSQAYKQSLQSALDKLGLSSSSA